MTAPARTQAFQALQAIDARRDDLPAALARARTQLSDARDRALAAEIVTGTLRWQRLLDYLIAQFAARPLTRLDPEVLTILRLSVHQLLHLDRVPASAVVNDAVDLTRRRGHGHAAGFVNAVLRSLVRTRHRLPVPPRPPGGADRKAALAYLGIAGSHPDWLVARWLDRYGFEAAEAWVRFNNATPPLCLRVNRLRTSGETLRAALAARGVDAVSSRWAPDGLIINQGKLENLTGGDFLIQDEASQLVAITVGAKPGEHVLDLCASPGGKATALAAEMDDTGMLVATDVRARRVRLLRETVARAGATATRVLHVDPDAQLPFASPFDRVLVDAPCSGLGTLRRDPDIRWRREESDLAGYAASQAGLLARAAEVVAPGGRLVYATCSSEPEENEEVVERFLAAHPAFRSVDLAVELPQPLAPLVDRGRLRTLPFAHGLEAFFAAALTRS